MRTAVVSRLAKPRADGAAARLIRVHALRALQATTSGLQLINGDFEQGFQLPAVLQAPYERLFGTATSGAQYVLSSRVAGWKTTASNGIIEIWSGAYSGVKAASGKSHAELNADQVSALYQARPGSGSARQCTVVALSVAQSGVAARMLQPRGTP